jgi:hypothetical protein
MDIANAALELDALAPDHEHDVRFTLLKRSAQIVFQPGDLVHQITDARIRGRLQLRQHRYEASAQWICAAVFEKPDDAPLTLPALNAT